MPGTYSQLKVAIVILNWNGRDFLEQYLPSVIKTMPDYADIIVADNASTDDSILFLKNHYPQIRIIALAENYGFAKGYNEALRLVEAEYYILLNSDVKVSANWIEPVIDLMDKKSEIAAAQPKIRSLKEPELFEYAGAAGGWIDKYGYPFCRGRVFETCEKDSGQYEDTSPIFWASGACLFIRSKVFKKLGGFDPYFFAHQEEIDLCWRIQQNGYQVFAVPKSVVYHLGGGSLSATSSRKLFLNARNNLIMLHKNLPRKERIGKLFLRMVLDGIAGVRYIMKGQFKFCWAIIKAHFGYYKWLNRKEKSMSKQENKSLFSLEGVYKGSIINDYFLKNKKTFSRIVENKP